MTGFKNWTDYHQRLNLVFHGIVAFTMIPFAWLYLEIDSGKLAGSTTNPYIIGLLMAMCLVVALATFIYRKRMLIEAVSRPSLREKMEYYSKLQIKSFALLEGAAMLATLGFFLTASYLFVVIYIVILFVFSLARPQLERTCKDLLLKKEDRNLLAERNEIP